LLRASWYNVSHALPRLFHFLFYLPAEQRRINHIDAARYRRSHTYLETLAIYTVLSIFMLGGTVLVNVIANLQPPPRYASKLFQSFAFGIIGALIYLIPRYHYANLQLKLSAREHGFLLATSALGFLSCALIWFLPPVAPIN
jgi:hypothetical protein